MRLYLAESAPFKQRKPKCEKSASEGRDLKVIEFSGLRNIGVHDEVFE